MIATSLRKDFFSSQVEDYTIEKMHYKEVSELEFFFTSLQRVKDQLMNLTE